MTKRHIVIPDLQVRPGDNLDFIEAIGRYVVKMRPDVVVNLGDMADMPSLSSYDIGKKSFEGMRYIKDVEVVQEANRRLFKPLNDFNANAVATKHKQFKPRKVFLLGNHENRIDRAVNNDAKLEGLISTNDLKYKEAGWEVHPFLNVAVIDGIAYSHYFVTGTAGRPCSTAQVQLNKKHQSCIAGHQQGLQIAMGYRADGKSITSIIAGSAYEHDEHYMGPQGNKHWRGILVLHEVNNGEFDCMPVSLSFIKKNYS